MGDWFVARPDPSILSRSGTHSDQFIHVDHNNPCCSFTGQYLDIFIRVVFYVVIKVVLILPPVDIGVRQKFIHIHSGSDELVEVGEIVGVKRE